MPKLFTVLLSLTALVNPAQAGIHDFDPARPARPAVATHFEARARPRLGSPSDVAARPLRLLHLQLGLQSCKWFPSGTR